VNIGPQDKWGRRENREKTRRASLYLACWPIQPNYRDLNNNVVIPLLLTDTQWHRCTPPPPWSVACYPSQPSRLAAIDRFQSPSGYHLTPLCLQQCVAHACFISRVLSPMLAPFILSHLDSPESVLIKRPHCLSHAKA
jgi:hypothetical protein